MKKFIIISAVLIVLGGAAFGYSLYHYISSSDKATPDEATISTEQQTQNISETQSNSAVPQEWLDGGIFSEYYDKAYSYVSTMTTEQMVGQLILGTCPNDDSAQSAASQYSLGGYVYDGERFDYLSVNDTKQLIYSYQQTAQTPMIMAVCEEGGNRTTISDHDAFSEYSFDSPRNLYAQGGLDLVKTTEQKKAEMLSMLGINLNMAPVCDMAEEFTQIMYSRSLGGDVNSTCDYAKAITSIEQDAGVSVALKHFPGYGTIPDTTDSIVTDTRDYSQFESTDFKPFEAGVQEGAHFVMVSNVLAQNLDPTHIASLSQSVHGILRDKLKFTGLIITDNLDKADYSAYADGNNTAVAAVLAGNDMICVDDIDTAYRALLAAADDGTIKDDVIKHACTRIIAYKYMTGLMDKQSGTPVFPTQAVAQ